MLALRARGCVLQCFLLLCLGAQHDADMSVWSAERSADAEEQAQSARDAAHKAQQQLAEARSQVQSAELAKTELSLKLAELSALTVGNTSPRLAAKRDAVDQAELQKRCASARPGLASELH